MQTVLFGLVEVLFCFSAVVLIEKLLGKEGVYGWVGFALLFANIQTLKIIDLPVLGSTTMGTVLFASLFLSMDILNEKYGAEYANKAVWVAGVTGLAMFVMGNLTLLFQPGEFDWVNASLCDVLNYAPFMTLVSVLCMMAANFMDVRIFSALRNRFPDKLWLRNNVSTIICNLSENLVFYMICLCPLYGLVNTLYMVAVLCVVEAVLALLDTPFLYLSKRLN